MITSEDEGLEFDGVYGERGSYTGVPATEHVGRVVLG